MRINAVEFNRIFSNPVNKKILKIKKHILCSGLQKIFPGSSYPDDNST